MNQTLLFISIIAVSNVIIQLLLKKGVFFIDKSAFSFSRLPALIAQIFLNGYIVGGLVMLGALFILWLFLISKTELSALYPAIIGLNFVLISIATRIIFKEYLSPWQIVGIVVIIIGIFLVLKYQF